MRLHELGETHVVSVARARAQERKVRRGEEGVRAGVVSGGPPARGQSR